MKGDEDVGSGVKVWFDEAELQLDDDELKSVGESYVDRSVVSKLWWASNGVPC